jgi:hypothetical protein
MGEHIDEAPERVADKEARHAPRFENRAILDREAAFPELVESDVQVIDFDR